MKFFSSATFWKTTFAFTFIVNAAILAWSISRWIELKVIIWRSIWVIPLILYISVLTGCIFLFNWIQKGNSERLLFYLDTFPDKYNFRFSKILQLAAGAVFAGIVLLIPYLKFTFHVGEVVKKSTQDPVLTTILYYWFAWWLILLAAGCIRTTLKTSWAGGFASALVIMGVVYELYLRLQLVTDYPFSMGWSESSRFYYGSLFFARSIYGMNVPLSAMHPTRYLLQAIPFLIPGLSLAFNRFWQFFLWIGLTGITSFVLIKKTFERKDHSDLLISLLMTGWVFLYFLRVGVYYHLQFMVFIPLLFVSKKNPRISLFAIIISSAWAGISRVNWIPLPAIIAITIYILEEPVKIKKSILEYLQLPVRWALSGVMAAFAAMAAYIPLSGNTSNIASFASSFTSPKLWYRILPNDSYSLGIVPGILLVTGPLLLTFILAINKNKNIIHPLRIISLWIILMFLFAGGILVSVKIGGGADLHNMDAFAVELIIITMFFIGGKVTKDRNSGENEPIRKVQDTSFIKWPILATGLIIPIVFLIPSLSSGPRLHPDLNNKAFLQLKNLAEENSLKGPVLFINERHLLTFHKINIPLVPEYEAVTLMEMAMSNNQAYLQQFYNDLQTHKFSAIITGKQNLGIKEEGSFADENNIWNTKVSPFILCNYEPIMMGTEADPISYIEADQSRIEVYLPRVTPVSCP